MKQAIMMFLAMPFIGVRIGIPQLTGKGNTTPPAFTPSLNFSDARNSQYLAIGII